MQTLKRTELMSNFISVLYSTLVYYYMIEIFRFETQCFFLGSKRSIVIAKAKVWGFWRSLLFLWCFMTLLPWRTPSNDSGCQEYIIKFDSHTQKKVKKKVNCRLHAFQEAVISLHLEKKKVCYFGTSVSGDEQRC